MTTFSDIFKSSFMENLVQRQYSRRPYCLGSGVCSGAVHFSDLLKKPMLELCILQDLGLRSCS